MLKNFSIPMSAPNPASVTENKGEKQKKKERSGLGFWIPPLNGYKAEFLEMHLKGVGGDVDAGVFVFGPSVGSRVHREGLAQRRRASDMDGPTRRPLEPLPSKANSPPGMTALPR